MSIEQIPCTCINLHVLTCFNGAKCWFLAWYGSRAIVRASVCPHFQQQISPQLVSQLQSNFIRSIIGEGERLHKVLGQVGSELWFPWQHKAPIGLQWEKCCEHSSAYIFDRIFFILAGNEDSHKIWDEFEIWVDSIMDCGVRYP